MKREREVVSPKGNVCIPVQPRSTFGLRAEWPGTPALCVTELMKTHGSFLSRAHNAASARSPSLIKRTPRVGLARGQPRYGGSLPPAPPPPPCCQDQARPWGTGVRVGPCLPTRGCRALPRDSRVSPLFLNSLHPPPKKKKKEGKKHIPDPPASRIPTEPSAPRGRASHVLSPAGAHATPPAAPLILF